MTQHLNLIQACDRQRLENMFRNAGKWDSPHSAGTDVLVINTDETIICLMRYLLFGFSAKEVALPFRSQNHFTFITPGPLSGISGSLRSGAR